MDEGALGGVLEMHLNSIANADTEEWTRHLAVESPVTERRAFREPAFELYSQ